MDNIYATMPCVIRDMTALSIMAQHFHLCTLVCPYTRQQHLHPPYLFFVLALQHFEKCNIDSPLPSYKHFTIIYDSSHNYLTPLYDSTWQRRLNGLFISDFKKDASVFSFSCSTEYFFLAHSRFYFVFFLL